MCTGSKETRAVIICLFCEFDFFIDVLRKCVTNIGLFTPILYEVKQ
jgi:hypothetical protein